MNKILLSILPILILIACNKDSAPTEITQFQLNVTIQGQGHTEKLPDKPLYEDGTELTLQAFPDSGWEFKRWEGSILKTENPVLIKMDGDKTIKTVFELLPQKYEPDITGKWGGVEYLIDLDLVQQSLYASSFTGTATVQLTTGDTIYYSISGHNTPPNIEMFWNKSGYYQIHYNAVWENESKLNGAMTENSVQYDLDFVKINGLMKLGSRKKIDIGNKIIE